MVEGIGMDARDSSRHVAEEPSAGALLDALPIEPIPKRQNLRNQVADQITELIVSGALPAGTRLTELGMAERLGVSRVPVREAFLILQGDQWVDIQESHGAKVHVPHPSEVENIYEVRMALESSAAALACRAADDAAIAELSTMANYGREVFLKDGGGDVKLISNVNERFHDRIAQLSGNPILRRMIDLMIKKPRIFSTANIAHPRGVDAWNEHVAIADAIEHGEAESAGRLMYEHIRRSWQHYHDEVAGQPDA